MNNAIALLGSTGSIGTQTLEVASKLGLRVEALSAGSNVALLEEQTRRFKPSVAAVYDEDAARDFKARVRDTGVRVVAGADGLVEAATVGGASTVVTAVVGMAGLLPTRAAIRLGRRLALAHNETLGCAGAVGMSEAREHGATIVPVDSEHSAIFQCLHTRGGLGGIAGLRGSVALGGSDDLQSKTEPSDSGTPTESDIKKIILTASGGPFRGMSRDELRGATPEMALRHPNWAMGQKVTIDSATMMNKGLEAIEAIHLFSIPPEKVEVIVHPESIVHSMVEFSDNSIIAQLALPDMRLPIQYALTYPRRMPSLAAPLDMAAVGKLTFAPPDTDAFPCLELAFEAMRKGGAYCSSLNGANEAAVELFLRGRIGFYGIHDAIRAALDDLVNTMSIDEPTLNDIIEIGSKAKAFVLERYG
jgi:1-deoxy-D-xylulose-5-phosphate reductoisomerase